MAIWFWGEIAEKIAKFQFLFLSQFLTFRLPEFWLGFPNFPFLKK
jgi:hypothetical protein